MAKKKERKTKKARVSIKVAQNIEFLIWKKKKKTFDSKMINVNLKF